MLLRNGNYKDGQKGKWVICFQLPKLRVTCFFVGACFSRDLFSYKIAAKARSYKEIGSIKAVHLSLTATNTKYEAFATVATVR